MFSFARSTSTNRKAELGFLLLNLLAEIDGNYHQSENLVVNDYISKKFLKKKHKVTFLELLKIIEETPKAEHFILLKKYADEFKSLSSREEQMEMLLFFLETVNADNIVAQNESVALEIIYSSWEFYQEC